MAINEKLLGQERGGRGMAVTGAWEPRAVVVNVTPEKARIWLQKMKNRKPNMKPMADPHVEKLAQEMRAGRWVLNGETIKFNSRGQLIDGQHRLYAVIKSECPIRSWVVFGIDDPDAFKTIDSLQLKRGANQILEMMGMKNTNCLAAIARRLVAWEKTQDKTRFSLLSTIARNVSQTDVIKYAEAHSDEIAAMVSLIRPSLPCKRCKAPSALMAALILCNRVDDVTTYLFIEGLKTGANLKENSVVILLRERMLMPPRRVGPEWETEAMALTIKAWNYFTKDKPLKFFRWRQEGDAPEKFPVPGEAR